MKLHFAGADGENIYSKTLKQQSVVNKLESYHSLGHNKAPCKEGFNLILDSGGFVARLRGVPIDIYRYIEYLNKYEIDIAFNLDTNDIEETLKNQELLDTETNTYIIPVYHNNEHFVIENNTVLCRNKRYEWLLPHYVDNYPYISIGGIVGNKLGCDNLNELLSDIFLLTRDKVRVHGLGCTSKSMLEKYPFYSVDSTSWLAPARYGRFSGHIDSSIQTWFAKNHKYTDNIRIEIPFWLDIEKYITDLWACRGVVWDDFNTEDYK